MEKEITPSEIKSNMEKAGRNLSDPKQDAANALEYALNSQQTITVADAGVTPEAGRGIPAPSDITGFEGESITDEYARRIAESGEAVPRSLQGASVSVAELRDAAALAGLGVERPRPAPEGNYIGTAPGALPRYEVDPDGRMPSIEELKAMLPAGFVVLARSQLKAVQDELIKRQPDDIRDFSEAVLDLVFGEAK